MLTVFAVTVGLVTSPAENSIEQRADALLSGDLDPLTYDYGSLRFDAPSDVEGWRRLQALERAVSVMAAPDDVRDDDVLDIETVGCRPAAALGGVRLAKMASDRRAYEDAHEVALEIYRASVDQFRTSLAAASSPMDAALIRDAFWRELMLQPVEPHRDAYASEFVLSILYGGLCRADERNARFLRVLWSDRDQFFEMIYGEDQPRRRDLVQHAPLSLQRDILAAMERREAFGQTSHQRKAQAFLTDRVRVRSGESQIFATQGHCVQGRWRYIEPVDLEAARGLRRSVGLPPLEESRLRQHEACRARLGAGRLGLERAQPR